MSDSPAEKRPLLTEQDQLAIAARMGTLLHKIDEPAQQNTRGELLKEARAMLDENPRYNILAAQVGFYMLEERQLDEARTYFNMALKVDPKHVRSLEGIARIEWLEYVRHRDQDTETAAGHLQAAKKFIDKACRAIPQDDIGRRGALGAPALIVAARIVLEKGRIDGNLSEMLSSAVEYLSHAKRMTHRSQPRTLLKAIENLRARPENADQILRIVDSGLGLSLVLPSNPISRPPASEPETSGPEVSSPDEPGAPALPTIQIPQDTNVAAPESGSLSENPSTDKPAKLSIHERFRRGGNHFGITAKSQTGKPRTL